MSKVYTATRTYTVIMKDTIHAKNEDEATNQLEQLIDEGFVVGDAYTLDLDDVELEGEYTL